jgi:dTDP-4-dehydrorhamnose 3,5-epimerase
MRFEELTVAGAFLVHLERREDERGSFARTFCVREFEAHGLNPAVVQCSLSYSEKKGTVRGLHYQVAPALETKLVRCTRGAAYNVLVDLRSGSATHGMHVGVELTAAKGSALYVPASCANGLQTLADETELLYMTSGWYSPDHERGVRYDDPSVGIQWPLPVTRVSAKDLAWPPLHGSAAVGGR